MVEATDSSDSEVPEPTPSQLLPRRRIWPALVALVLVVLAVGLLLYREMTKPLPLRVLVAVEVDGHWWQGSSMAARVADAVSKELDALGFEPVRAGDPDVEAALEEASSVAEAARRLRAAFVVGGRFELTAVELPVVDGFVEVRAVGGTDVARTGDAKKVLENVPVEVFAAARKAQQAKRMVAKSIAEEVVARIMAAMVRHPSLSDVGGRDVKLADQLAPAKLFVNGRERLLFEPFRQATASESSDGKAVEPHKFGSFTDPMKYGSSSVGVDVAFPRATHAYGLPERTVAHSLPPTLGKEPYRLFNLDVFEYILDYHMGVGRRRASKSKPSRGGRTQAKPSRALLPLTRAARKQSLPVLCSLSPSPMFESRAAL